MMGAHKVALARCHEALEVLQRIGDRFGEAETWDSLGFTYRQLGDWAQAMATCAQWTAKNSCDQGFVDSVNSKT